MKVEAKPSNRPDIVITLSATEVELYLRRYPNMGIKWTYPEHQLHQSISDRIREIYRLADE